MMRKNSHKKMTFSYAGFMRPDTPEVAAPVVAGSRCFSYAGFMRPDSPEVADSRCFSYAGFMRPDSHSPEVADSRCFSYAGFMRPDSPEVVIQTIEDINRLLENPTTIAFIAKEPVNQDRGLPQFLLKCNKDHFDATQAVDTTQAVDATQVIDDYSSSPEKNNVEYLLSSSPQERLIAKARKRAGL